MERICRVCSQSRDTPYKDICRKCYTKQWLQNIPEKTCDRCASKFSKSAGATCWPCLDKIRKEKSRKVECTQCKRVGLLILNMTEKLCTKCDRKKKETADPSRVDKRRHQTMMSNRRVKGKDLNAPKRIKKGWWKTALGYVMIWRPDHPNANSNGCINEHTFVMTQHIGRALRDGENVHHINGVRDDNRIENLELWHRSQCPGQRLKDKLEWCKEFLLKYGYLVTDP